MKWVAILFLGMSIVYQKLFIEGVLYTPKNKLLPNHPLFPNTGIRNVEVLNILISLKSREYVVVKSF